MSIKNRKFFKLYPNLPKLNFSFCTKNRNKYFSQKLKFRKTLTYIGDDDGQIDIEGFSIFTSSSFELLKFIFFYKL